MGLPVWRVPQASAPEPGNRRGTGGTVLPVLTASNPVSGDGTGRPQGDAKMRGLMAESLNLSRKQVLEAMRRR